MSAETEKGNFTYILQCRDGSLYTGWTNNPEKRFAAHNAGKASRYTRAKRPVMPVYLERFATKREAMQREAAIKRLTRAEKLALIAQSEIKSEKEETPMVRKAEERDLPAILSIYEHARAEMKKNGNPTQWGDDWPPEALVRQDIPDGISYVVEENGVVGGVFAFIFGIDPTYIEIEGGKWLNEEPYGTIHRIASGGVFPGVFRSAVSFCSALTSNIRIDTHENNAVMLHLLKETGFVFCGTVYVRNHESRVAFQKVIR